MQKIGIVIALALALFAVPALAQTAATGAIVGNTGVDILAQGIFESEGSAIQIPEGESANIDAVIVGNDRALAFGTTWHMNNPLATAENNLEIKKNQDSGACASCCDQTSNCAICQDACTKVNIESIKVGDRNALAFGFGTHATNNVKIVTNQQ